MKMLHTCLRIKDLDASLDFYKNVIGLKEIRRIDHSDYGFILVYLGDGKTDYELELTYNFGSEGYDLGNGFSHLAVSVKDLELQHEKHLTAGYKVTDLKGLPNEKPHYYFITDPDGYLIEILRENS